MLTLCAGEQGDAASCEAGARSVGGVNSHDH